ncbi:YcxB family protein [Alteromonas sp. ZYF713]|nr:YcxB family protein [Alteromonas sp. ZYF713]
MEVRYTNTKEDLIAFNEHHLANNKAFQKRKRLNLYISPLFLLLAFSVYGYLSDSVGFYVGGIVGAFVSYLWTLIAYKRYAKKCADTLQKEVFCEHKVTVSEQGVSESTQNSSCHFNWDAIDKVEYNESYLFIYNTPATAFVIPKRELGEEVFADMKKVLSNAM